MKPPSGGPITGPIRAGMVSQASEEISSDFGTLRRMTRRPTGTIMAPPRPCTMRKATNSGQAARCAAQHRAAGEHRDGGHEHGARAVFVRDPAADGHEHREAEEIARQRELQRDGVLVEARRDGRQRGGEHRGIEVLHEQAASDDERNELACGDHAGTFFMGCEGRKLAKCAGSIQAVKTQNGAGRFMVDDSSPGPRFVYAPLTLALRNKVPPLRGFRSLLPHKYQPDQGSFVARPHDVR